MATSYTRNLKLRINSNATADSKYNLEKIDTLAGTYLPDSTDALNIRSRGDITLEPNSSDLNGSGVSGSINIGTSGHKIASLNVQAEYVRLSNQLGMLDQSLSGTKYLYISYKSDSSGSVDNSADRTLTIDLEAGNRSLVLGGNLATSGGNITLITLAGSTVTIPVSGILATLSGNETFINKTIDASAGTNTITGIRNVSIASDAAISGSKIANVPSGNLAASDVQSALNELQTDIDSRATTSALASHTGASTAHGVSGSLVGTSDPQTLTNKQISGAANTITSVSLTSSVTGVLPIANGGTGSSTTSGFLNTLLPNQAGNNGKVLGTDGANTSWVSSSAALSFSDTWTGTLSKLVTHNLGTSKISVVVREASGEIIYTDVTILGNNSIQLDSSEIPSGTWNITIIGAA